jgi:large subunit ribosomal protein L4e
MKTQVFDIHGTKIRELESPKFFHAKIREDIVSKILEAMKKNQPYAPSLVAGKQHAAKGKVKHLRHVWRSGYGRGGSRVPRKIFYRRGSQFNWEAAEVPFARGGMRAHPPKVISMINTLKINKKEMKIAMESALSSTANPKEILKRYASLENDKFKVSFPLVLADVNVPKTKDLLAGLRAILGNELFEVGIQKRKVRSGKGKLRGRKYKRSAGLIIVTGNDEKLKTNVCDVKSVKELSVKDIAKGGLGRLAIYTENAIKDLEARMK